jgi:hypothetical protein
MLVEQASAFVRVVPIILIDGVNFVVKETYSFDLELREL